jgi:hypothetical protein
VRDSNGRAEVQVHGSNLPLNIALKSLACGVQAVTRRLVSNFRYT